MSIEHPKYQMFKKKKMENGKEKRAEESMTCDK